MKLNLFILAMKYEEISAILFYIFLPLFVLLLNFYLYLMFCPSPL